MSLNSVTLVGNMTRDPELRQVADGVYVCSFGIAVQDYYKKDKAHFIDCEAWRKTAEFVAEYFHKGSAVGVVGTLKQDKWEQDGQQRSKIMVTAEHVRFVAKRSDDEPKEKEDIPF
jgi:single-strand DNA-binding protein